jgi:ribosome-associated protein
VTLAPGVRVPEAALRFTFTTSQGPGGQNVNKRSTRAVLRVRLSEIVMPEAARTRLERLASHLVTLEGELLIAAGEHRSQGRNKDECVERLSELVKAAMVVPKVRRPTKPTRGSKERRLREKRVHSERKQRRRDED